MTSREIPHVVAAVMEMPGEGVARTFAQFPPLEAFRLDIAGSIAGTVLTGRVYLRSGTGLLAPAVAEPAASPAG